LSCKSWRPMGDCRLNICICHPKTLTLKRLRGILIATSF
jgi:hypothetical protein